MATGLDQIDPLNMATGSTESQKDDDLNIFAGTEKIDLPGLHITEHVAAGSETITEDINPMPVQTVVSDAEISIFCKFCDINRITLVCKDCDSGICSNCSEEHLNIPGCENHNVCEKPQEKCIQCKTLYINFFCEQCNGYLCEKCKTRHIRVPICKHHQIKTARAECFMCECPQVVFKCRQCTGNLCSNCLSEHDAIPDCQSHTTMRLIEEDVRNVNVQTTLKQVAQKEHPTESENNTASTLTKNDTQDINHASIDIVIKPKQPQNQVLNPNVCVESSGDFGITVPEVEIDKTGGKDHSSLLKRLGLETFFPHKMKMEHVLLINEFALADVPPKRENELPLYILHKIMMLNYKARSVQVQQHEEEVSSRHVSEIESEQFLGFLSHSQNLSLNDNQIHPLDILLAIFYCSDQFLQQYIVSKLADCQIALPFLIQNTIDLSGPSLVFPLWILRNIRKSWCCKRSSEGKAMIKDQLMSSAKGALISFVKIGELDISKSELMNSIICKNSYSIFFHRDCKGSTKNRVLANGIMEFCWYLPGGKADDEFDNVITFTNLRGNAMHHQKQLEFICNISNIVVVLSSEQELKSNQGSEVTRKLLHGWHTTIVLVADSDVPLTIKDKGHFLGIQKFNRAQLTEKLHKILFSEIETMSESDFISIEGCKEIAKRHAITSDENGTICMEAHCKADAIIQTIQSASDISLAKQKNLPLQGGIWHEICLKTKELYRPKAMGDELIEERKSKIRGEIEKLKYKQTNNYELSDTMSKFVTLILTENSEIRQFSLKWLKLKLDQLSSESLPVITREYNKLWISLCELKKKKTHENSSAHATIIEEKNETLKRLNQRLINSSLGLEHLMRELAQLFAQNSLNIYNWEQKRLQLPVVAATMLLEGFPVEVMDGDADNVSVDWLSAVLDNVSHMLKNPKIFVIGVLGIQSSGKSTLLNAMFGLQFSVSAGRCTRGAFIQMLKIDNSLKTHFQCDYVIILDTEGLRAPEISNSSTQSHDNELATFVTGLGDITVVNIFGENPTEMHDILQITVQAFLRMKKIKLKPKCYFVHQNVAAVGADEKLMAAKRNTMEKLDEMTKIAAEQENSSEKYFRDVISFDINEHVWYLSGLWEGDPPMAPPNPGYSEKVQQLKSSLLDSMKRNDKSCLRLSDFKERINDLWNALLHENFVFSFKNSLEISVYRDLERNINSWKQQLHHYILDWQTKAGTCAANTEVQNLPKLSSQLELELRKEVECLFSNISQQLECFFKNHPHKELLLQWKSSTVTQLKLMKNDWVSKAIKVFTERCNSQDIHSKFTKYKASYDDQLVKKAQELALRLKANLPDSKIKKIFDNSWDEWLKSIQVIDTNFGQVSIFADAEKVLLNFERPLEKFMLSKMQYLDQCTTFELDAKHHIEVRKNFFQKIFTNTTPTTEHCMEAQNIALEAIKRKDHFLRMAERNGTGYSYSYLEQIISDMLDFIRTKEHRNQEFCLTNCFLADVAIVGMCNSAHEFETLQIRYVEDNDPKRFLEKNKEKHYETFTSYVRRASEGKIAADRFLSTLTECFCKAIKENTGRIIASDALCNVESFTINRFHLEKSALRYLVRKRNFDEYMSYIKSPVDFFTNFIKEQLQLYAVQQHTSRSSFKSHIVDLIEAEVSSLYKLCESGQGIATNGVIEERKGMEFWGETFKKHVMVKISILEGTEQLNRIKLDQEGLKCFTDVVSQQMPKLQTSISQFVKNLQTGDINDAIESATIICKSQLIENICWEKCPFCFAVCTNTLPDHGGDHSVPFHRPIGVNGWYQLHNQKLCVDSCAGYVGTTDTQFLCPELDIYIKYCMYRTAGIPYSKWAILPDNSLEPHWKWFVARFKNDLEKHYKKQFKHVPLDWYQITIQNVLGDLETKI